MDHEKTIEFLLDQQAKMFAGLIGIVAVVIPGVLLMVIAGFGLLLMFAAQYFLWARWLYPIVVRMEQRRDAGESDRDVQ